MSNSEPTVNDALAAAAYIEERAEAITEDMSKLNAALDRALDDLEEILNS